MFYCKIENGVEIIKQGDNASTFFILGIKLVSP